MEKILTDGVITDGRTSIDESMVTGERGLNLCWAAGCNAIAIPLAADILYPVYQFLLPPAAGAVVMSLSTVIEIIPSQLVIHCLNFPLFIL